MVSIVGFLALVGVISSGFLITGLFVSVLYPEHRFWPHGERDWGFYTGWMFWAVYIVSFFLVGYLDFEGFFSVDLALFFSGSLLIVVGVIISLVAVVQIGIHTSTGVTAELYTGGIYRYTRNPQYIAFILMIVGYIILSGSLYAGFLGFLGFIWLIVAPLAEEPWLQRQYGEEYKTYKETTPRFVGIPDEKS